MCFGRGYSDPFTIDLSFNGRIFFYAKCADCSSVYISPLPSESDFQKMYCFNQYHRVHYGCDDHVEKHLPDIFEDILNIVPRGSRILDYGCGTGALIQRLQAHGYECFGVEYASETAIAASQFSGACVSEIDAFDYEAFRGSFDLIYLGDVLEHLPDPILTLRKLGMLLKADGVFCVQGPLENNVNLVYILATIYSLLKKYIFRISRIELPPTHLMKVSSIQQRLLFCTAFPSHRMHLWRVFDSGWPYSKGGLIKRCIAYSSVFLSGFGKNIGNRFVACFSISTS